MSVRGMEINPILCPIYGVQVESMDHLMFSCSMSSDLLRKLIIWLGIGCPELAFYDDWLFWFKQLQIHSKTKKILERIFYVLWWKICDMRLIPYLFHQLVKTIRIKPIMTELKRNQTIVQTHLTQ